MTTLATSGNILEAKQLHNRLFSTEVMGPSGWEAAPQLALFDNTAFLGDQKLSHIHYHSPSHSVTWSYGKGVGHSSARLFFSEDGSSFTGTMLSGSAGEVRSVRGNLTVTTFDTSRAVKDASIWVAWQTLEIGTKWDDTAKLLVPVYVLGTEDIADRTAVTAVVQWQTTIEMQPSLNPLSGESDQFMIVVAMDGQSFTGTYTDADGVAWQWKGTAKAASRAANVANAAHFVRFDRPALNNTVRPEHFTAAARLATDDAPDLSVQDLMNVSAITAITINGQTTTVDAAQTQTGKYFQDNLINALEDKWITDFFGSRIEVPARVQAIATANATFYQAKGVMNLGQLIHDNFGTDTSHKALIASIDNDALYKAWKALGTDADYGKQSSPLYTEGYRDGVPGIQPYLQHNPRDWAKQLHDLITSEHFLAMWGVQVASNQFKNVKQQMYEWYVQLSILADDDQKLAQDMLNVTFATVIRAQYNAMRWCDDLKPFLKQAIDNLLSGSANFQDAMLRNNAEQVKQLIGEMVSTFDTVEQLSNAISNAMTAQANRSLARAADEASQALIAPVGRAMPAGWKAIGGKVLGSVMFAAGAGFLIYQIASGQDLNPIQDINLAILATGFMVKSIEKLLATGIGAWIGAKVANGEARLEVFASKVTKWFSEGGVEAEGWAVRLFGKSSSEFFAKRLGPALAVIGIVISAIDLAKAIKSGDVRDIVFESINTFFALAGAVAIGLELMSFAWAGPVGLAIAVIGAIVALVQLIWNLVSPPEPPPDPVAQFINGPLKTAGFVTS